MPGLLANIAQRTFLSSSTAVLAQMVLTEAPFMEAQQGYRLVRSEKRSHQGELTGKLALTGLDHGVDIGGPPI